MSHDVTARRQRILIAEDNEDNLIFLQDQLTRSYEVLTATDGLQALATAREKRPDLILLDVMMPGLDGIEVCRRLRADASLPFMPIIMVTARTASEDIVAGLEAGADEYLAKPVDPDALVARVRSMLRIKSLSDERDDLIRRLEEFIDPPIRDQVKQSAALEMRRTQVTVVFCDLRGYTAFADRAQPEDIDEILRTYHGVLGPLIREYGGTLERFTGDGVMVFFNAPQPCPSPERQAVEMAVKMRDQTRGLTEQWRFRRGYRLGFGVGIDQRWATVGPIGFESRKDYAVIGSVTNCAARVCGEAEDGQVLITQPVYAVVEHLVECEPKGDLELKGFYEPVPVYNVAGLRESAV